ncbi:uncharacterized protein [Diabrotica undecimpunctata]|uniref:uncharacterized protein n=1 Tax=Diabrotica undecimpunctata TaxID=50387 RepID=UPI003B6426A5
MIRVYLLCCAVVLARAQIPSLGFCPDYLPMSEFDIESFLGKWYEAERYFQFTEVTSRCVVTDYAKGPSGKIYVSNEVTSRLTGIKRVIDGQLELSGRSGEGKFNVRYSTPLSSQAQLTVLDTDYDNYAVIWSCSGFGPIHTQSVWAMTRERLPSGPVLQKIYGVLDKYKISRNFFVKTDQEGCALAASDINAANGITVISTVAESSGIPQRKSPSSNKKKVSEKGQSVQSVKVSDNDVHDDPNVQALKSIEIDLKAPEDILPEPFASNVNIPEPATAEEVIPEAFIPKDIIPEPVTADEILPEVFVPKAIIPKPVLPEVVIRESADSQGILSESIVSKIPTTAQINSGVIKSVPFISEQINIVETPATNVANDAVQAIVKSIEAPIQQNVVKADDQLKPIQVAEVIIRNSPIEPVDIKHNLLKAQLVPVLQPVAIIASEDGQVPGTVEVIGESITPVKMEIDEKIVLLDSKTN